LIRENICLMSEKPASFMAWDCWFQCPAGRFWLKGNAVLRYDHLGGFGATETAETIEA
jgi:hypothetical protein